MKINNVKIPCGKISLLGNYQVPPHAKAMIVFAHGSGSSRLSPRNQRVAQELFNAGFGTLLFDLLTEEESESRENVFDIDLLSERLVTVSQWIRYEHQDQIPIGYFGASTGAAAALEAATQFLEVFAVVSRGGRPDLAPHINLVAAPTLLIVGGEDHVVLELNRRALKQLRRGKLEVVPGATHLFEETGAIEKVIALARDWFEEQLKRDFETKKIREEIPSVTSL